MFLFTIVYILFQTSCAQSRLHGPDIDKLSNLENPRLRGMLASPGQAPYQLQLLFKDVFHCGATLIYNMYMEQVVLTAAQCVSRNTTDYPLLPASKFKVLAGQMLINGSHSFEQFHTIKKIFRYPKYFPTFSYHYNDVAVLHLSKPFNLNRLIRPIKLTPHQYSKPTDRIIVSGWGHFNDKAPAKYLLPALHIAEVRIVDNIECNRIYQHINATIHIERFLFCAGAASSTSYAGACESDTGGPAVSFMDDGTYLAGIYNWRKAHCNSRYAPSIYTDISYFLAWINAKTTSS